MSKDWISAAGNCKGPELNEIVHKMCSEMTDGYYLSMHTDRFIVQKYLRSEKFDDKYLLELRVFDEKSEILFSRNCISEDFSWRYIADDSKLDKETRYERFHIIDRVGAESSDAHEEADESGLFANMSGGGGTYYLPMSSEYKRVKVITYVDFDENGMAFVADNRVCGWRSSGKEDK